MRRRLPHRSRPIVPSTETPPARTDAAARSVRVGLLVLTVLTAAVFAARVVKIRGSLPYSLHFDERHLTERAREIMQTGDWNPHWFRYPCVPLYLTTAGMSAGLLRSAAEDGVYEVGAIGNVATPYYDEPAIVFPARLLFALLGTLSLLLAGGVAWRLTGSPVALVFAPVVLAVSTVSQFHAWAYLNVDTIGTFLVLAAVFHALGPRGRGVLGDGLAAGAFAGLAIGSKYSLYPILLPGLLRIAFGGERARLSRAAAFLATAVVVFAVTTPGLLDLPAFLDGLAFEVHHYARGHGDATIEAGLPHLRAMLAELRDDLGTVTVLLAVMGAAAAFLRDRVRAASVVAFPIVLLVYLAQQRVQFERNVLPLVPFVAILASVAVVALAALAARAPGLSARPGPRRAVEGAVIALALLALPLGSIPRAYDPAPDSRRVAVEWIAKHVADDVTVFVAEELEADVRALAGRSVIPFSLYDEDVGRWAETFRKAEGSAILLPVRVPAGFATLLPHVETVLALGRTDVKTDVPEAIRGTPGGSLLRPGGSPHLRIGRLVDPSTRGAATAAGRDGKAG